MRYQSLDQLRGRAHVAEAAAPLTREARLRRWADLLARYGPRQLNPLQWVEFYAEPERRRLRRDGSPISVAYADPMLRSAGLTGDTLGEAQAFFGLSDELAHRLLCDCHYHGRLTGRVAARRVRAAASPGWLSGLASLFGF
jgi:hypothetical protein